MTSIDNRQLKTRRNIMKTIGGAVIAVPVIQLFGCGSSENVDGTGDANNNSGSGNTGSGSTGSGSSGSGSSGSTGSSTQWASGGTAYMTENFPEDSLFETATTCVVSLTGQQTEGPCYFSADTLDDISEGQTGLPMMLCLRLVDNNCQPISGYEIEVWHCDVEGIYSGDTSGSADTSGFSSNFCTGNDSQALQSKWFRGYQVTDSNGRVNFKTCFPGWYSSRAIHVHFRVRNNNNDELVSQFGFTDSFNNEICSSHVDYENRGTPDTSNTRDTVFGSDYEAYLFDTSQNQDGSLLAYKTIQISTS